MSGHKIQDLLANATRSNGGGGNAGGSSGAGQPTKNPVVSEIKMKMKFFINFSSLSLSLSLFLPLPIEFRKLAQRGGSTEIFVTIYLVK
jgi:hypothetical protein